MQPQDCQECCVSWKANWCTSLLKAASSHFLRSSSSFASWCAKTVENSMYCLYCFNHLDSLRCFLASKVNIQLTLCSTPSSLFLASSVLFLQLCLHDASRLWQCGCIVFIDSTTQTLLAVFWHEKSTFNWLYVLLQAASTSRLLCSSSSFASWCAKTVAIWMYCLYWFNHPDLFDVFWHEKSTFNWLYVLLQAASSSCLLCSSSNCAYIMRKDSDNVDVLSELIQPPRLSSLLFGMKSQHSTDSMFYSKQPLPRVFCALPRIVPTTCVKTLAMWMYCLYWFNHPDSFRCYLAWKVNIQLTLCSTPSSLYLASSVLFLQFCLVVRQDSGNVDVLSSFIQSIRLSSLFFGMKSQHSTDSMFYSSSLFLASSVLFLQSCLHHAKGLWQCGCIVFIDSTTQTLFAVIWHEKSTFNWLYVLLQAASSSRLLCSSSNRAYIMRQDSGNVDVLSLLIQPPSRCYLAWKVNIQLTLCSTPSSLFLASSVLFLESCLQHASRLWQCGCIVFIDSTTQTLFAVFWHEKSTFNWLYVLLQAASSSRLLCSSSNCAYIMRKDSNNVDVLSSLIQPPRLSSLFFGMKSQHSTDSMFYSKQPLPRVFCALPPVLPRGAPRLLQFGCIVFIDSTTQTFSLFFGMKGQHSTDSMFYSKQPLPRVFCALPRIVPTTCVKTLAMWMYCLYWFNHPDSFRCFLAWKVNIQLTLCSTPSSLFLASSVLFLQSCLHHASRLWQCGCIVFIDSITQTLFAVFWHEKSTFNWLYVLL